MVRKLPLAAAAQLEAGFATVQQYVNRTAREKGWWDDDRSDGEAIALIHAELSEMLEALRSGNPVSTKIPMNTCVEEEAADVVIRLMDLAQQRGWNIAGAIINKLEYNDTREYKHGKRF